MKTFPTIVAGVFIVLGLIAVFIFATFSSSGNAGAGSVAIWGPYPDNQMQYVIGAIQEETDSFDSVSYRFVPEEEMIDALVSAIASGRSPDLVVLDSSHIYAEREKLLTIPFSSISRRDFQDSYIEAGEALITQEGIKGIPFTADPLVMYWNRTLFSNAGIAQPPKHWDELALLAPRLTKTTEQGTLIVGTVALGSWDTVVHAKAILLSLIRQLGNAVIVEGEQGYKSAFNAREGAVAAGDSAVRFYTEFADPVKPVYSWNRSQPSSREAFIASKVAVYFGRASEVTGIRAQNPNLNFDIARVPSIRGGGIEVETDLKALVIPRGAKNSAGALLVAQSLAGVGAQEAITTMFRTPSVRRDALSVAPSDPYLVIFRDAALASFAFRDPSDEGSNDIFKRMIEAVASGAMTVSEAVSTASGELSELPGVQ